MLKSYFGDVKSGRLQRLPFLGYFILLQIIMVAIAVGIGAGIGAAESLVGGDLQQAQEMLRTRFGIPVIILLAILFGALFFAMLNLEAKRIRDMGLPGWWTLLAVAVISIILGVLYNLLVGAEPQTSSQSSGAFSMIILLALLLIPSDTFAGNND